MPDLFPGGSLAGDGFLSLKKDFLSEIMIPPITAGLKGAYYPAALSKKGELYNHADSTKPLTRKGTLELFANYARCDSKNCFDTGLQTTSKTTIFAIAKPPVNGLPERGLAISDWTDQVADLRGSAIEMRTQANGDIFVAEYVGRPNGTYLSATQNLAAANILGTTGFQIVMLSWNDGSYSSGGVYNPITKSFIISNHASGVTALTGRNILLGGNHSKVSFLGKQDIAGALIYDGKSFNITEFDTVGTWLYFTMCKQLGIV